MSLPQKEDKLGVVISAIRRVASNRKNIHPFYVEEHLVNACFYQRYYCGTCPLHNLCNEVYPP